MNLQTINRRSLLALAGSAPLLGGCFYDQFFDIEWDEEVKLHDGRVIVARVKNTYERRNQGLRQYDEDKIMFRRKEIAFEPDPGRRVLFKTRMPVAYLGQFGGEWFAVISGQGPFGNYADEMPTHWGSDFNTSQQRLATLQSDTFVPVSWDRAPLELKTMNMMRSSFFREFVAWDGKRLTIDMKANFEKTYPTPNARQITRPIRMNKSEGNAK